MIPTRPRLYGLARSVYTRIARLALEEKAQPYDLEEVDIFGREGVPQSHFARHPFGRIPVLVDGGFTVYETAAITRYVDEAFAGIQLQPSAPQLRARMVQVINILDAYCYRPMVWGVFVQRIRIPLRGGTADEAEIAASMPAVSRGLEALAALQNQSPFFVRDTLTLADLHAYPMLRYLSLASEGASALARHPNLVRWLGDMRQRPSVAATATEYE